MWCARRELYVWNNYNHAMPEAHEQIYLWSIHPHDAQLEELELKGIIMVKGS